LSQSLKQDKTFIDAILVYFQPKLIAILFLGFSSGVPYGILTGTLSYWVSKINISTAEIGLLVSAGVPYTLKFLWSPFVDQAKIPILYKVFGQRRSWLILCQCLLIPAIVYLGQTSPDVNYMQTYFAALVIAVIGATQDIVIDGLRIESLENEEQAAGAANYIYGYRIAGIIYTIGAIYLYAAFGVDWPILFLIGGLMIGAGIVAVLYMKEPVQKITPEKLKLEKELQEYLIKNPHISETMARVSSWLYMAVVAPFKEFSSRRGWYVFLLFAVFYKLGDSLAISLQTKFFLTIGFDDLVIANAGKLVGFWALLIGLAVGGALMVRVGLWYALLICAVLQLLSNLVFSALYVIGDNAIFLAFTMGFENFATGMGATVLVAYLSLLCNRSFTVTQYALLAALHQFTVKILSSPSGYIVEITGWFWFFIFTAIIALPGILLLFWIRYFDKMDDKISNLASNET
jgi:MFS transporter, PAT family, beta-lactamase induction signal transducer AmpG